MISFFYLFQGFLKTYSSGFVNGVFLFANLTAQLGPFSPTLLLYFPQLKELDISGCIQIDSGLFCDCIAACTSITKISMKNCSQFSQYQLSLFVRKTRKLRFLECSNCDTVAYGKCIYYSV